MLARGPERGEVRAACKRSSLGHKIHVMAGSPGRGRTVQRSPSDRRACPRQPNHARTPFARNKMLPLRGLGGAVAAATRCSGSQPARRPSARGRTHGDPCDPKPTATATLLKRVLSEPTASARKRVFRQFGGAILTVGLSSPRARGHSSGAGGDARDRRAVVAGNASTDSPGPPRRSSRRKAAKPDESRN